MPPPKKASPKFKSLTEFDRAEAAANFIFSTTDLRPKIALVLGSGLGAFADEFCRRHQNSVRRNSSLSRNPPPSATPARLLSATSATSLLQECKAAFISTKAIPPKEVSFPIRVFARMGVKAVILTNAAGGIKHEFTQGRLVVIKDHINLQGVESALRPQRRPLRPALSGHDRRLRPPLS